MEKKLDSGLKTFGWSFASGMTILATILFIRHPSDRYFLIPGSVAVVHFLLTIFWANGLKFSYLVVNSVGKFVFSILGTTVLTGFYFLLFSPIALILRLFDKDVIKSNSEFPRWTVVPEKTNNPQGIKKLF